MRAVSQPMEPQQPYQPQPGYGPPPPPPNGGPPPPGGVINLTVQGSVLTNSMVPPTLTINGHRVDLPQSGSRQIPAPAGMHHLQVASQWLRTYGQAELTVQVAPGQRVDVFYAAPFHQFATGNLGFEPQAKKGKGCLIGLLAVLALIVIGSILAIVFG